MYLSELLEEAGLASDAPVELRNWRWEDDTPADWREASPNIKANVFAQRLLAVSSAQGQAAAVLALPCGARALLFKSRGKEGGVMVTAIPVEWVLAGLRGRLGCQLPPARTLLSERLSLIRRSVEARRAEILAGAGVHYEEELPTALNSGIKEGYASRHIVRLEGCAVTCWAQLEKDWTLPRQIVRDILDGGKQAAPALWSWLGSYSQEYLLVDSPELLHHQLQYPINCVGAIRRGLLQLMVGLGKPSKSLVAFQLFNEGTLLRFSYAKKARWMGWLPHRCTRQLSDAIVGCDSENFRDECLKEPRSEAVEFVEGEAAALSLWITLRRVAEERAQ